MDRVNLLFPNAITLDVIRSQYCLACDLTESAYPGSEDYHAYFLQRRPGRAGLVHKFVESDYGWPNYPVIVFDNIYGKAHPGDVTVLPLIYTRRVHSSGDLLGPSTIAVFV